MVDNPKDVTDNMLKALEQLHDRFGGFSDSIVKLTKITQEEVTQGRNKKVLEDEYKRALKLRLEEEKKILQAQKEGRITAQAAKESLSQYNETLRSAIPDDLKGRFDSYINVQSGFAEKIIDNSGKIKALSMGLSALTAGVSVTAGMFGKAQSSSSGVSVALDMATSTVNAVGDGLKFLGENAVTASMGLAVIAPELAPVMLGIGKLGEAAGGALNFFAKDIMPIMNKNIETMVQSFKEAGSAGALFAGGITELRETAHDAGVDTLTFSKMLKESSGNLALFGGDVVNGGRRVVAITKDLSKSLGGDYREKFIQMGYSVEEIPGIIATVGAEMRRSLGDVSNQQVANSVADYAKNLRVIADLTGQDAKTLQQKADAEFQDLKFKQFMSKNVPVESRKQVEAMLAAMPADELALVKSRIVGFGNISDDVAGVIASQVPAYEQSSQQIYSLLASGRASVGAIADIDQSAAKSAAQQKLAADDFASGALIAGGNMAAAAQKMGEGFDATLVAAQRTQADFEKFKTDLIAVTTSNMNKETQDYANLEKQSMDARIATENAASAGVGPYTEGIKKITDMNIKLMNATGDLIKFINDNVGTPTEMSRREQGNPIGTEAGSVLGTAGGLVAGAEGGALAGAAIGSVVPVVGTAIGGALGAALGAVVGAYFGNESGKDVGSAISDSLSSVWNNMTGHEFGGIASGPDTGYMAKLHGTEAILPPDLTEMLMGVAQNKDSSNNKDMISQMMGAISAPANQQNDLMQTLINKIDDLISATKDVASHTERTAARVA
jgi:hypothetical protein